MLDPSELNSLAAFLTSTTLDNQRHSDKLRELFGRFSAILEDYSALRTQLEKVVEQRDEYKKQVRGQVGCQTHRGARGG